MEILRLRGTESDLCEADSRVDYLAAACYQCTLLRSQKGHELIRLQHPNDFEIRNSDDLHVKILFLDFEITGEYCG